MLTLKSIYVSYMVFHRKKVVESLVIETPKYEEAHKCYIRIARKCQIEKYYLHLKNREMTKFSQNVAGTVLNSINLSK